MNYKDDDDFTFDALESAVDGDTVSDAMASLYKTHDYSMKDIFGAIAAMRGDGLITTAKRTFLSITKDGLELFNELYGMRYRENEEDEEEEKYEFIEELHFVDSKNFRNPDLS